MTVVETVELSPSTNYTFEEGEEFPHHFIVWEDESIVQELFLSEDEMKNLLDVVKGRQNG